MLYKVVWKTQFSYRWHVMNTIMILPTGEDTEWGVA